MVTENMDRGSAPDHLIGCLTYRSKAASPPTEGDLTELVAKARVRNRRNGVTGMLLYEDGHFVQTLEGPPKGLDAIWSDIKRDDRHTEIEVLTEHLVPSRVFSEWDLLLYRKLEQAPQTLREKLRREHPLAKQVSSLVRLALEAEKAKLNALFAKLAEQGWHADDVARHLIEPAARALGDAWLADECSEFELTLALGMLQMASHAVRYSPNPDAIRASNYSILLATAPGEPHMLSLSLMADQFTDAGWSVEMAFPDSDEALANQISDQRPDALDISLSDALPRPSRVTLLRETVGHSRDALPSQPIVVSVGGRLFAEASATAEHVGADHARKTVAGMRIDIGELVENCRASAALRRSCDEVPG